MKSDSVKKGMATAPQRSLFNALGMTKEEMKKPMVGIVSSYNEIVPGHMNIDKIVEAVKLGVAMAGGTPVVFPAIAVCDGIAMGHIGMKYSLVTRDLIADSTECLAKAHAFDGMVCSAVVRELSKCLINGKINKIYQPNNNEVLLGVYNMGKNYVLNLSIDAINYRINLTTHAKKNPKNVFNFCMVLRKHLTGGTIKRIYMNGKRWNGKLYDMKDKNIYELKEGKGFVKEYFDYYNRQ